MILKKTDSFVPLLKNEKTKGLLWGSAPQCSPTQSQEVGSLANGEKNKLQKKWKDFFKKNSTNLTNMIDLVKYPIITEKTYLALYKNLQYTFDVDKRLSKPQIKNLFENLFNVNIVSVNTHIPPRTTFRVGTTKGYKPLYKRAILTLKEGQSINYKVKI